MSDSLRVRRCKAMRDRIYDKDELCGYVFKQEVLARLFSNSILVDVGCGREAKFLRSLAPRVGKAYGVDPDIRAPVIDGNMEIMRGDGEAIPLEDDSVDVVTMVHVTEHLRDPERVFSECCRVLRPGGSFMSLAPCKFYPPIFLGRAIPHRLRKWANRITTSTATQDTFRAYYRANSRGSLRRLSSSVGLETVSVEYLINHPEYYMFSRLVYRCAVAVERLLLKQAAFACLRHQILCHLKKPDDAYRHRQGDLSGDDRNRQGSIRAEHRGVNTR